MYFYTAYGLSIQSELVLPELLGACDDAKPDVVVRLGDAEPTALRQTNDTDTFLVETEAGRFLIRAGREVVVDPAPGVEEAVARIFLLGPIMAVLLRLRGLLVLHASGVAVSDETIAFLGDTGWGKSTLAEAFFARGHCLVTDDVMAIQMQAEWPMVLPSFPQIKLWPGAAASFGYSVEQLPQLHSQVPKRVRRLSSDFSRAPLPLRRIYVLGPSAPDHAITPLQPQEAFMHLVRHSRAMAIPKRPDLNVLHFGQVAGLINQVPVCHLRRRPSLGALSDLVKLIETHLSQTTN